jgi:hypothetical protein
MPLLSELEESSFAVCYKHTASLELMELPTILQASVIRRARDIIALGGKSMSTIAVAPAVASPQEMISALPLADKRELTVWLLSQFDSNAILDLLREVQPASVPVYDYDYEDPGPLADEASLACAEECFLLYDREEAAYEKSAAR